MSLLDYFALKKGFALPFCVIASITICMTAARRLMVKVNLKSSHQPELV